MQDRRSKISFLPLINAFHSFLERDKKSQNKEIPLTEGFSRAEILLAMDLTGNTVNPITRDDLLHARAVLKAREE